jgi:hypothetical protein
MPPLGWHIPRYAALIAAAAEPVAALRVATCSTVFSSFRHERYVSRTAALRQGMPPFDFFKYNCIRQYSLLSTQFRCCILAHTMRSKIAEPGNILANEANALIRY